MHFKDELVYEVSWTSFWAGKFYIQYLIFSIFVIVARCWLIFFLYFFWTVRILNFQVMFGTSFFFFLIIYNIWGFGILPHLKMQILQFKKGNTRLAYYFCFTTECLQRSQSSLSFIIVDHAIFHRFNYTLHAIKLKSLKRAHNLSFPYNDF